MSHYTNRAHRRGDAGPGFLVGLAALFLTVGMVAVALGWWSA
ncbi:hypothetical protein [Micromonospora inyonensis]|uniref:MYXO-CTERM domain-containing protein n=1 Tax=Micromonospora inyonensis TaxID=47866 RepID=A0A1C6RX37_9ACTN|nr:hypothetical protein [Micromonospora inyonensis]SCL21553.1 hypothetical protein GA0074694_3068 [Micromonospora inyonensis]SCL21767.1 hypothetical protein GA0074694_3140 [Micromonospora inyonensis]